MSSTNNNEQVRSESIKTTALILAGGAGQRFGGLDKGLERYEGKPLIEHVIGALEPQVDQLIISANRNQKIYQRYAVELINDEEQTFQGPMAGIYSALVSGACVNTNALLVATCDSPQLPADYVAALVNKLQSTNKSIAVVHDGVRRQNLHCLIKHDAWDSLLDFYSEGHRAMHRWFETIGVSEVDFSTQADCFKNINSPDQLR